MKETSDFYEEDDLPAFWRMDFNINMVMSENLDFTLDVQNVTNRKNMMPSLYYPAVKNYIGEESGITSGVPEPGTSVLVRATYRM